MPILAIDAGNSRTKWGVHGGGWLAQGVTDNAQVADLTKVLRPWRHCRQAVVSNVAGAVMARRLQAVLAELDIAPVWVAAQAAACGVSNGYDNPLQLGSDRWAALVAAWHQCHAPCVVITAGTALTVDALSGTGHFLGGFIVPGRASMRQALAADTVAVDSSGGKLADFPSNTADAACSGVLRAMAGAVEAMCDMLQAREGYAPVCLIGGGDASALLPALHRPAQMADNLTLDGLVLIAGEMA